MLMKIKNTKEINHQGMGNGYCVAFFDDEAKGK